MRIVNLQTTVVGTPRWVVERGYRAFAVPERPGLGLKLNHEACAAHPRTGARIELFEPGWELRGEPQESRIQEQWRHPP